MLVRDRRKSFGLSNTKRIKTHSISSQFFSRLMQGFSNKIPVQSLIDSYECTDGLNIDKSPLFDPAKPFNNRDPRLTQTVVLPQSRFLGVVFETHPDSLQTWDYRGATPKRIRIPMLQMPMLHSQAIYGVSTPMKSTSLTVLTPS